MFIAVCACARECVDCSFTLQCYGMGLVACRQISGVGWGWLGERGSTRSIYEGGNTIRKLVLTDNYKWDSRGIQSRRFIEFGSVHAHVSARPCLVYRVSSPMTSASWGALEAICQAAYPQSDFNRGLQCPNEALNISM